MLGYTEEDILGFRKTLYWAKETALSVNDEPTFLELVMIDDFFEGLLAEGRI